MQKDAGEAFVVFVQVVREEIESYRKKLHIPVDTFEKELVTKESVEDLMLFRKRLRRFTKYAKKDPGKKETRIKELGTLLDTFPSIEKERSSKKKED